MSEWKYSSVGTSYKWICKECYAAIKADVYKDRMWEKDNDSKKD